MSGWETTTSVDKETSGNLRNPGRRRRRIAGAGSGTVSARACGFIVADGRPRTSPQIKASPARLRCINLALACGSRCLPAPAGAPAALHCCIVRAGERDASATARAGELSARCPPPPPSLPDGRKRTLMAAREPFAAPRPIGQPSTRVFGGACHALHASPHSMPCGVSCRPRRRRAGGRLRVAAARGAGARVRQRRAGRTGAAIPRVALRATRATAAAARPVAARNGPALERDGDRRERSRPHAGGQRRAPRLRRAARPGAREPRDGDRARRGLRGGQRGDAPAPELRRPPARRARHLAGGGDRAGGARHAGRALSVAAGGLRRAARARSRRGPQSAREGSRDGAGAARRRRDPRHARQRRIGARGTAHRRRLSAEPRSGLLAAGSVEHGTARARRAVGRSRAVRDGERRAVSRAAAAGARVRRVRARRTRKPGPWAATAS